MIHPKCVQLPFVTSVEPSTASVANTPITIRFNIPVEDQEITTENSLFSFNNDNIVINCNGININDKFETPYFNDDKTELIIMPKSDKTTGVLLNNYIKNEIGAGSVELKVSFSDAVKIKVNENEIELQNKIFSVYYLQGIDRVAPTGSLFITRDSSITLENASEFPADKKFHKQDIELNGTFSDDEYSRLVKQNVCNGTIYIYGSYYDDPAGIKNVVVREEILRDRGGAKQGDPKLITTEYSKNSPADKAVFKTVNGVTYFLIKHTITTHYGNERNMKPNGAISLDIYVNDYCYISSEIQHYTVIRNNDCTFYPDSVVYGQSIVECYDWTDYDTYIESYVNHIKSIIIYGDVNSITLYRGVKYNYDDIITDEKELHFYIEYPTANGLTKKPLTIQKGNFSYTYVSAQTGLTSNRTATHKLTCDLSDFVLLPRTSIKILVEDFLGNSCTPNNSIQDFPSDNNIYSPSIYRESYNNYVDFYVYNEENDCTEEFKDTNYILIREKDNEIECIKQVELLGTFESSEKKNLTNGYTYSIMVNGIRMPSSYFSISSNTLPTTPAVDVEQITPDNNIITLGNNITNNHDGFLTVTIRINDANSDGLPDNDYDYIYCEDHFNITVIPKDTTMFTTHISRSNLENEDTSYYREFTFYGYKNRIKSVETHCVLDRLNTTNATQDTKNKYDCDRPILYSNTTGNQIEFVLCDDWSGMESGYFILKGKKHLFTVNQSDPLEASVKIPVWEFLPYRTDNSLMEVYGKDKAGNEIHRTTAVNSFNFQDYETIVVDENMPNTFILSKPKYFYYYCYFYKFEATGFPPECSDLGITNKGIQYSTNINGIPNATIAQKYSSYSQNTYLKVFYGSKEQRYYGTIPYIQKSCTNPLYYYYGTPGNKQNDLLEPNGNSTQSVLIGSDKPVYVHTLVTSAPLELCSTWDYTEWEYFKEEYNEKILNFSSESDDPQFYFIPVNKIDEGKNYVVIAHYSNNNVKMSPIMTK